MEFKEWWKNMRGEDSPTANESRFKVIAQMAWNASRSQIKEPPNDSAVVIGTVAALISELAGRSASGFSDIDSHISELITAAQKLLEQPCQQAEPKLGQ